MQSPLCSVLLCIALSSSVQATALEPGSSSGSSSPRDAAAAGTRPAAVGKLPTAASQAAKTEALEFDFGKAWAGDTVTHTFEVPNPSDRVLGIRSVNTTCGCTTTGTYDRQVQPGQAWKLEAALNTHGRQGKISKAITVTTDDPGRPQIELVLQGEVRPRFELSPAAAGLGALMAGSRVKRTLTITNKQAAPVAFTPGAPDPGGLKTTLREIEKGQRYELDIETVPPLMEIASFPPITLKTDLKEEPTVTIPVYGYVQSRVMLAPKIVMVAMPISRDVRRELRLQLADGTRATVTRVETSNPAIRAIFEPSTAGQPRQQILVTIPKGTQLPADGDTLTVYTDDPEFPSLTCQIRPFNVGRASASRPTVTRPSGEFLQGMHSSRLRTPESRRTIPQGWLRSPHGSPASPTCGRSLWLIGWVILHSQGQLGLA